MSGASIETATQREICTIISREDGGIAHTRGGAPVDLEPFSSATFGFRVCAIPTAQIVLDLSNTIIPLGPEAKPCSILAH